MSSTSVLPQSSAVGVDSIEAKMSEMSELRSLLDPEEFLSSFLKFLIDCMLPTFSARKVLSSEDFAAFCRNSDSFRSSLAASAASGRYSPLLSFRIRFIVGE